MTIPVAGVARIVINYTMANGDVANNVLHYGYSDAASAGNEAEFLEDVEELFLRIAGETRDIQTNQITANGATAYYYNAGTATFDRIGEVNSPVAGLSTAKTLPAGNAALISTTTTAARTFGRAYIPGIAGEWLDEDGFITPVGLTRLLDIGLAIYTSFTGTNGTDFIPVVWRPATAGTAFIVDVVANAVVAYQRRRRRGVGS